jgi:hypothetical protein
VFVVHVVDVGTGLGVFVEGEDFSLVYDAGSNDDLATGPKNRFTSYLRAVKPGLKSIGHVVLSQPMRSTPPCVPCVSGRRRSLRGRRTRSGTIPSGRRETLMAVRGLLPDRGDQPPPPPLNSICHVRTFDEHMQP